MADISLPAAFGDAVPNPNHPTNTANPPSADPTYKPRPLLPTTFTGTLNTTDARLESNYRLTPLSSEGATNAIPKGKLYQSRLAAQLELNHLPPSQHAGEIWNQKRREAVARGEDPNSEMLWRMEHRVPDSQLERLWRRVRGKKATVAEEREWQERKAREREEGVGGSEEVGKGKRKKGEKKGEKGEGDGVIR